MKYTTTLNTNPIPSAEARYREYLNHLNAQSVAVEDIKASAELTEEFTVETYHFIRNVVLYSRSSSNKLNILREIGYERDMAASDLTMHIVAKLETIPLSDIGKTIPLIVLKCNSELINIIRRECGVSKSGTVASSESDYVPCNSPRKCKNHKKNELLSLEEAQYDIWEDHTIDIEADYIRDVTQKEFLQKAGAYILSFFEHMHDFSRFETLSFLATRIVTDSSNKTTKTSALAALIDQNDLFSVSETYFRLAAAELGLSCDVFSDFKNDQTPKYENLSSLSKKISHATNNFILKAKRKCQPLPFAYAS